MNNIQQRLKIVLSIAIFLFLIFPVVISQTFFNTTLNISVTDYNASNTLNDMPNNTPVVNETNVSEELPVLVLKNVKKEEINGTLTLKITGWVGYSNGTGVYGAIIDVAVSSENYAISQYPVSDENGNFIALFSNLEPNQTYQVTLSYRSKIVREEIKPCDESFLLEANPLYTYQPVNFTLIGNAPATFEVFFNQSKIYSILIEGSNSWEKNLSLNLSGGKYLLKLYGNCNSTQKTISVILNVTQNVSDAQSLELRIAGKNEFLQNETVKLEVCLKPNTTVNCTLESSNETRIFSFLVGNESCSLLELKNLTPDNYTLIAAFQNLSATHKFAVLSIKENITEISIPINETLIPNKTVVKNVTNETQNLTLEETEINVSESFQFPILITGKDVEFNLDNNLESQGILIFNADGASLNCNGKEIRGEMGKIPGIFVLSSKNIKIVNCKVSKFINGIVVFNSSNVEIQDTQFYNNNNGLIFFFSDGISVSNVIALNNSAIGMFVYNSKISEFRGNQIQSTLGFSQLLKLENLKKEVIELINALNL